MFSDIFTTATYSRRRRLLAGILIAAGVSTSAFAADFEEIVVTATKRATTIQDVPFSINAQTQQDIQRSGATNLEELSRNVAGLTVQNLGPGQSQVAIRGVSAGQIIRDQPGVKEQVGVYMDESVISLSLFTPDFDLYDLNRVETLRGPQGTLYGSGSIGGTIRYITNDPNMDAFDADIEFDLNSVTDGDVGGHVKGMVNFPFADGNAAVRVVGYTTEYGGFVDALGEGGSKKNDVDSGSRSGGRIELKYTPTDRITMTPRLIYQEIDTDGFNRQEAFNLYANPYTTTRPAIEMDERQQYLLLDEKFSDKTFLGDSTIEIGFDSFDVTFVGSYTDRKLLVSRDASALTGSVSVDLGYPDAGVLLPSNLRDNTKLTQSTYELRFTSNDDGPLQWLGGMFYADMDRKYKQRLPTPGYAAVTDATLGDDTSADSANGFPDLDSPYNADLPYHITQFAVFGEVTYDLTDRWHLVAGGRYYDFDEKRSFTSGGLFSNGDDETDKTTSDGFTPRILASYDVSEDVTFNAQISQGFRLGGVNDPLNETLCTPDDLAVFGGLPNYKDEKLWNYEVGFKSRLGGAFTLNAAAFYADMENLQVTLDAGSCSSRVVLNVPDAHSTGAEFELAGNITDALAVTVAGSILNSEFDSTVRKPSGEVLGGVENGNRLASVPKFQIAATATYTFPLTIGSMQGDAYLNASFQHIGDRITQPSDQVPGAGNFTSGLPFGGATGNEVTSLDLNLESYTISNLRAGFMMDSWDVAVYVDNLADENANTSFDRERGGRARLGYRTNQPRTVGLTVRKGFGN